MFEIPVSEGHFGHETRRLTIAKAKGISADYCLACDCVIKYVFGDAWTEGQAREWLAQMAVPQSEELQQAEPALSGIQERLNALGEAVGHILELLAGGLQRTVAARVGKYGVQGFHSDFGKAEEGAAWGFSAEDGNGLIEKGGWELFKKCHLVCDVSEGDTPEKKDAYTYPVAKLVNGKATYFLKAAQTVYAGLRGGARGAQLPDEVDEAVLKTVKRIYGAFGKDTADMKLSLALVSFVEAKLAEGMLPVFEFSRETKEGVVVNDKGWVKKPILRTGEWVEAPKGATEPLRITMAHLQMIKAAYDDGAFERVSVPLGHGSGIDDIDYVTQHNTGFVMALEISEREDGEFSLDAWLDFTDLETEKNIRLGNIWNCSVMLTPTVRPSDGKRFPIALKHVALTNYPWVEGLPGFVEASRSTIVMQRVGQEMYRSDNGRIEMELTKEQQEALEALEQAKLKPEEVITLAREQEAIQTARQELEQEQAELEAEKAQLAKEAQEAHVGQIVLALEGKHELDGVAAVEGTRHYPAVVKAVEEVLRAIEPGMSIQLSREGKEEASDVEALVLSVVNAIPQEARMAVSNPSVPEHVRDVDDPDEIKVEEVTDEDLEAFAAQ